jgi:hypothetical protein
MIKFSKNKRKIIISSVAATLMLSSIIIAATPGSSNDPLITLSYFEQKIDDLKEELEKLIKKSPNEDQEDTKAPEIDTSTFIFKIENLKAGSTLKCGEGAEFIIRTGEMKAIASASGGLSDVTSGENIDGDKIVPKNHHIVVPRGDGRGLQAVTGGAIMIKGNYEVIETKNE